MAFHSMPSCLASRIGRLRLARAGAVGVAGLSPSDLRCSRKGGRRQSMHESMVHESMVVLVLSLLHLAAVLRLPLRCSAHLLCVCIISLVRASRL